MDQHTMVEQAYKNGYANGFEAGKKAAVVHGIWAFVGDACVCSVCHKASIVDYYFCPECGAMMIKEAENE